jgi:hypothetical protein
MCLHCGGDHDEGQCPVKAATARILEGYTPRTMTAGKFCLVCGMDGIWDWGPQSRYLVCHDCGIPEPSALTADEIAQVHDYLREKYDPESGREPFLARMHRRFGQVRYQLAVWRDHPALYWPGNLKPGDRSRHNGIGVPRRRR